MASKGLSLLAGHTCCIIGVRRPLALLQLRDFLRRYRLRALWLVAALFMAAALVSLFLDASVRVTVGLILVANVLSLTYQWAASRQNK